MWFLNTEYVQVVETAYRKSTTCLLLIVITIDADDMATQGL